MEALTGRKAVAEKKEETFLLSAAVFSFSFFSIFSEMLYYILNTRYTIRNTEL